MAVSTAVRRLLRVLDLEETLRKRELESAQSELARLELALEHADERQRNGRRLLALGVQKEDACDRLAGIEEVHAGRRSGAVLKRHIQRSAIAVEELRGALLDKRVERKQMETLIKTAEAREAIEADRRMQRSLDDWYLTQLPEERLETGGEKQVMNRRAQRDA